MKYVVIVETKKRNPQDFISLFCATKQTGNFWDL